MTTPVQIELTEAQRHQVHMALIGYRRELEQRIAAGTGGSTDNDLEAFEAGIHALSEVLDLLAIFRSARARKAA